MSDRGKAVMLAFARQARTRPVRDRLAELGFDGDAGDMIVVCPPGTPGSPKSVEVPVGARGVLYATPDASELGWAMMWADPPSEEDQ